MNDVQNKIHSSVLAIVCSLIMLTGTVFGGEKNSDATQLLDEINLGDEASEQAHNMQFQHSERHPGKFDQKSRRLLRNPESERFGGEMTFTLSVDPEKTNYVTFKFDTVWSVSAALYLSHNGDRIPPFRRRPLIPVLSNPAKGGSPFRKGCFYVTRQIPEFRTAGKKHIELTVRSAGGTSRPIYRIYSHTDAFFQPSPDEALGKPVEVKAAGVPEQYADPDLREKLIKGVDAKVKAELQKPPEDANTDLLLRIYDKEWSEFYQDDNVLTHIAPTMIKNMDKEIRALNKTGNWRKKRGGGHMRSPQMGRRFVWVYPGAEKLGLLDENVDLDDNPDTEPIPRRQAYAQFFAKRLNHFGLARNSYTSNIAYHGSEDACWLYKAIQTLDPERNPLSEDELFKQLYLILGFGGGEVTSKGLLRERRGYDSGYAWPDLSRHRWPEFILEDQVFKRRMRHMVRAMNHFIAPGDYLGDPLQFRNEAVISFRQARYPGRVTRPQFSYAAILEEPSAIRRAQLYLEQDNVFQDGLPTDPNKVDHILKVMEMPPTNYRLPMEAEHSDFVFADEEMGVIAMKHRGRRIYGSFVLLEAITSSKPQQRALFHYTTPSMDRIAYVKNVQRYKVNENGKRLGIELIGESNRKPGYKLFKNGQRKVVEISDDEDWPEGVSRRADFNRVRYGDYVFGMNTTKTETYELEVSTELAEGLVSGKMYHGGSDGTVRVKVPPRTTVVLYTGDEG